MGSFHAFSQEEKLWRWSPKVVDDFLESLLQTLHFRIVLLPFSTLTTGMVSLFKVPWSIGCRVSAWQRCKGGKRSLAPMQGAIVAHESCGGLWSEKKGKAAAGQLMKIGVWRFGGRCAGRCCKWLVNWLMIVCYRIYWIYIYIYISYIYI